MRQKTCLMAVGSDFRGFSVSAAARPTSSVPAKAKAAVTNTLQRPLKPLWKAPGLRQYLPPMYVPFSPPPIFRTTPRMLDASVWEREAAQEHLHISNDGDDLDDREDEFRLAISFDPKEIDAYYEHEKD